MKAVISIVGVIVGVLVLIFVLNFAGLKSFEFFGPKYRKVENKIYHESEQYEEGMVRDLENLRMEYLRSTPEQKEGLRSTILHRFSVFPKEKMNNDLRNFYETLQGGSNE